MLLATLRAPLITKVLHTAPGGRHRPAFLATPSLIEEISIRIAENTHVHTCVPACLLDASALVSCMYAYAYSHSIGQRPAPNRQH